MVSKKEIMSKFRKAIRDVGVPLVIDFIDGPDYRSNQRTAYGSNGKEGLVHLRPPILHKELYILEMVPEFTVGVDGNGAPGWGGGRVPVPGVNAYSAQELKKLEAKVFSSGKITRTALARYLDKTLSFANQLAEGIDRYGTLSNNFSRKNGFTTCIDNGSKVDPPSFWFERKIKGYDNGLDSFLRDANDCMVILSRS